MLICIILMSLFSICALYRERQKPADRIQCESIDRYYEIKGKYREHKSIYTDGSQVITELLLQQQWWTKSVFRKVTKPFIHIFFWTACTVFSLRLCWNWLWSYHYQGWLGITEVQELEDPMVLKILERHHYLCTVCDEVIIGTDL